MMSLYRPPQDYVQERDYISRDTNISRDTILFSCLPNGLNKAHGVDDSCPAVELVRRFDQQPAHVVGPQVRSNLPPHRQNSGGVGNRPTEPAAAPVDICVLVLVVLLSRSRTQRSVL